MKKDKERIKELEYELGKYKGYHAHVVEELEELKIRYDEANKHKCSYSHTTYIQPAQLTCQSNWCKWCNNAPCLVGFHAIC